MTVASYVTQGIGPDSSVKFFTTLGFDISGFIPSETTPGLPQVGKAYDFPPMSLVDVSLSNKFLIDPVIAPGSFKLSKDRGVFTDLIALPIVSPAGSSFVHISLTQAEMTNVSKIGIAGVDPNAAWADVTLTIDVPTGNIDDVYDLAVGDITETSTQQITKKKGTEEIIKECER